MKILISPAKSLDFENNVETSISSKPIFANQAYKINNTIKNLSAPDLSSLMGISPKLSELNWSRNQDFQKIDSKEKEAIFAFNGDVYDGIDANTINTSNHEKLQNSLRILSGLYGILKPLDIISPYRLEMGTKISVAKNKDLYEFWKEEITNHLNKDLKATSILVNLASIEYFSSVDTEKLKSRVISPVFKDFKNGQFKIISFYAKKARGLMAKYLIENRAKTSEDLKKFNLDGYKFSKKDSTEDSPVFLRK
mgnify:CR=1 FL=1